MINMFQRLWNDNGGSVVTTELAMVTAVMVFGVVPAMVAIRNGTAVLGRQIGELMPGYVPLYNASMLNYSGVVYGTVPVITGPTAVSVPTMFYQLPVP